MSLPEWQKNGWLKIHKTSKEEISNLLNIVNRDLHDCQSQDISLDWRFAIAYNAALQCCTIALYCEGYKSVRGQSEHYRVIQSIPYTLGEKYSDIRDYLNACRAKRNISDYDTAGTISGSDVKELIATAEELKIIVLNWLNRNYQQYI